MAEHPAGLLIYDLDGTLVDSVPDIAVALNLSLDALGHATTTETAVRGWVGEGARTLCFRALNHLGATNDAAVDRLYQRFLADYAANLSAHTTIYPGVLDCLRANQGRWKQVVVTNKPVRLAEDLLQALDMDGYFSEILGGDSLPQKKPHPAPLLKLMADQGMAARQTVMIGDSATDIRAARAAGVDSVAVTYGYNSAPPGQAVGEYLREIGADHVVDSLSELPDILESHT